MSLRVQSQPAGSPRDVVISQSNASGEKRGRGFTIFAYTPPPFRPIPQQSLATRPLDIKSPTLARCVSGIANDRRIDVATKTRTDSLLCSEARSQLLNLT
ncbi:hypothetical protein EVAR_70085_1 [Eumeta japonica]|uniref:Uncharacterized protein n=1 Tax=Eumeta variegata TaxID=151549 RepID=A0A4C1SDX0_EUMVA|nr:hypothetical protein EVAR_70085_1 [Eumeta japonica]